MAALVDSGMVIKRSSEHASAHLESDRDAQVSVTWSRCVTHFALCDQVVTG